MKYIIVKYACEYKPTDIIHPDNSVIGTYTAGSVGVTQQFYDSPSDAQEDLEKLIAVNPSVNYGVVKCHI